jgi:glutathione S-transferase
MVAYHLEVGGMTLVSQSSRAVEQLTLVGLGYSPWTLRARWALDHHHIPYHYHEHILLFEMPLLRLQTGRFRGSLGVPLLIGKYSPNGLNKDDRMSRKLVIEDSFAIALWAEAQAQNTASSLIPTSLRAQIEQDLGKLELVLDSGRALTLLRTAADRDVALGSLPTFIPQFLRPYSIPLVKGVVRYLDSEFGSFQLTEQQHRQRVREGLRFFWERLQKNHGRLYSQRSDSDLGLTFSDLALALALQFVSPAAEQWIPLTQGMRKGWTDGLLAREFHELLIWRDELFRVSFPLRRM